MTRREFIALLGSGAAWPVVAHAQKTTRVIGFMSSASAAPFAHLVAAFRDSLKATGFVEGQNVAIEFRWADGQYDRLQMIAAELVRREVAVIVATGGTPAVLPAMAATTTIPIVFITGGDPIKSGLHVVSIRAVTSYKRLVPGMRAVSARAEKCQQYAGKPMAAFSQPSR